ncbi:MAG: alanine racemase [Ignavibacteria bacterium]|nr:alanine racemase [Ignavibacteria bacterium]
MRLTRAEIHLQCLHDNLDGIRQRVTHGVKIMGIVKANAYGHGLVEIAQALVRCGVDYFGVGFIEEGVILRQNGITTPILVLGGVLGSQIQEFLKNDLEITVSSVEIAERIEREAQLNGGRAARVHLKIDTGMERIGVRAENILPFIRRVAQLQHLELIGVYSHFATADECDKSFAHQQLDRFHTVLQTIHKLGIEIPLTHIANSGAILDLPDSYFSMVRPGIMMYGVYPSQETSRSISLHPVLALKSNVVFVKEVPSGTSISYGRKYTTACRTKIATVPIGYGDGYGRRLTNRSEVLINGQRHRVVGTICMDQIMVEIGMDSAIHVGDEVTLLGKDGNETISAWDLSEKLGTIPYELFTGITARVPRVFIQ